eukprot:c37278_g1_i1 orf=88-276(+)
MQDVLACNAKRARLPPPRNGSYKFKGLIFNRAKRTWLPPLKHGGEREMEGILAMLQGHDYLS